MNNRIKLRLIGLAAAMGMMGLAISFMTVKSQRQAGELRAHLNRVDSESFRIADRFRDFLRQLNSSLYLYGSDHDPAELEKFNKASNELNLWIDQQKPKLATEQEKTFMQQIDAAYDDYLRTTTQLQTKLQSLNGRSATINDYTGLIKESQRLFDLGQALARVGVVA